MSRFLPVVALRPAGRSRRLSRSVERKKLLRRAPRIALDLGLAQPQLVAEQQPDLHIAPDQTEEGAERRLRILECDEPRLARSLQQRLQALANGKAAVGQHDLAEIAAA